MAKLGKPPAVEVLRALDPPRTTILAGRDRLARIYYASGPHPVAWNEFRAWGPATNARFDHHLPDGAGKPHAQSRKVLYCAKQGITCIAEVFQATRVVNRIDNDPYLCVFSPRRNLTLLDLTGRFATRMGASLAIHSGPRNRAREWARTLYEAFDYDGLLYLSSMDPGAAAIALNERAEDAMPEAPLSNRPLGDPLLTDVIDAHTHRLGYLKR
ncbi:MAG: RES family NAD+ phosphorylase [Rubrivivax sp.]